MAGVFNALEGREHLVPPNKCFYQLVGKKFALDDWNLNICNNDPKE